MKMVLWTMALVSGVATVAWVAWQAGCSQPPRPAVSSRPEHRDLVARQGQPRHWRACLLKSH